MPITTERSRISKIYSIHGMNVTVTGVTEQELQDDLLLAFRFARRLGFDQAKMVREYKAFMQMNEIARNINKKCGWPMIFVSPKTEEEARLWETEVRPVS